MLTGNEENRVWRQLKLEPKQTLDSELWKAEIVGRYLISALFLDPQFENGTILWPADTFLNCKPLFYILSLMDILESPFPALDTRRTDYMGMQLVCPNSFKSREVIPGLRDCTRRKKPFV